jgi:biofilm PGA synthesis N-glycosyltransferase PgaC
MPEPLQITLYVPCYNAERFLDETLPAVLAQTHPVAELVAVDDGSRDGTAEAAARHGLRVVRHPRNLGLAAARNTGVREACTAWVAALDADVRPHPDWLEILAAAVEAGRYAGACGQLREARIFSLADRWRDAHMRQWWGEERRVNPKFMFGNNTLVCRDALVQVGGYDERHRTNGEDVDISRRLFAAGFDLLYEPRAVCDHLRQDSLSSIARTFWNWHYSVPLENSPDGASIRVVRRKSGRHARRLLKRDLRARRWPLVLADLYVSAAWWQLGRRLRLRSAAGLTPRPQGRSLPPGVPCP